jgi:glycosyltransferase involved in cell wall biosynthesis
VADPFVTPAVSVVTPTWGRHDLLLQRAIPSVAAQDYDGPTEHIVVSDGPDPELLRKLPRTLKGAGNLWYEELAEHNPDAQWGHYARLHGIDLAKGEYIAYLDDDNSWHPGHLRLLVAALEDTGADFAYPLMAVHGRGEYVIGTSPPACGQIDTSMIVHRRELLDVATWRWYPGIPTIDWDLVERWMAAGATWTRVSAVTCDYYFH